MHDLAEKLQEKWAEGDYRMGIIQQFLFAVAGIVISVYAYYAGGVEPRGAFVLGIDILGGCICAAIYYGCTGNVNRAEARSTGKFTTTLMLVSAVLLIDELAWLISLRPMFGIRWKIFCVLLLLEQILEQLIVFSFWRYVKTALQLESRIAVVGDRVAINLLNPLVVICVVYFVSKMNRLGEENLDAVLSTSSMITRPFMLAVVALTLASLAISSAPLRQKIVAASFIVIPYGLNLISLAVKDYPPQYGGMMVSIVLMYSVIFYDRSRLLVSTQTELETAANIQETMLPHIFPPFPDRDEFMLYASMTPAKEVGGDFYDFFMIDDDHLGLVMADVSGKGVPAALVMTVSMASIRNQTLAMPGNSPSAVLCSVNDQICANEDMEMFVTAWLGIYTISTGELISANAGHEYPAIAKAGGPFELKKTKHGPPLGIYEGLEYPDEVIQLEPGDVLFLYTDGLPEATNTAQKMFGEERMLQALNANRSQEPKKLLEKVHEAADRFVGEAERFDDLTMMAVCFHSGNKLTEGEKL